MTEKRICKLCNQSYIGRIDQEYCCNAHKTQFFRKRMRQEKQRLYFTDEPIFFEFKKRGPLTYHERTYPDACLDLNQLFIPYRIAREALEIQSTWHVEDLRDECKEQAKFYSGLAKKVLTKCQSQEFSARLLNLAGKGLPAIARLYKQIAAQRRKLLREIKNLSSNQAIDVKLEESFKKKMKKAREKYASLWFLCKDKYIPKEL